MSDLKECRYNRNHKVKAGRLYIHETNCPDKNKSDLVRCSYEISHLVKKENLQSHLKICPNKPNIDQEVYQEMLKYVLKNGSKNKPTKTSSNNTNSSLKLADNNNNKIIENNQQKKFIAGLGPVEDKKEKKKQQREYRQLVNNSNLYAISQIDNDEDFEILDFDDEYSHEIENDLLFTNSKNPKFKNEDLVIINQKEDDSTSFFNNNGDFQKDIYINNKNNRLLFNSSNLENDDYDPNSSDIFIGKRNKNNINDSEFVYYH